MAIIYEKHYPHPTFEEEMKKLEKYQKELESSPDYKPQPKKSFDEFYKEIIENRTLILLPERMKGAVEFIKLAIKTSELYELDTKITREDSFISVRYSFDCGGDMDFLIPVFRQADNISFFTGIYGFELTICLDYYTHAVYSKGRLCQPMDFTDYYLEE